MRNEEDILKKLNWLEDEYENIKDQKNATVFELRNAIDELRWVLELE